MVFVEIDSSHLPFFVPQKHPGHVNLESGVACSLCTFFPEISNYTKQLQRVFEHFTVSNALNYL